MWMNIFCSRGDSTPPQVVISAILQRGGQASTQDDDQSLRKFKLFHNWRWSKQLVISEFDYGILCVKIVQLAKGLFLV